LERAYEKESHEHDQPEEEAGPWIPFPDGDEGGTAGPEKKKGEGPQEACRLAATAGLKIFSGQDGTDRSP
jgi:hypothetical protein